MRALELVAPGDRLSVLCLGAHSDDIEIGAGATILSLLERGIRLDVHWSVLSGAGEREQKQRLRRPIFCRKRPARRSK